MYGIDSTFTTSCFCFAFGIFLKSCQKKGYYTLASQLNVVYNKHTVYVCSSHATGDSMLMTVGQKDRACMLKPTALAIAYVLMHLLTMQLIAYMYCLTTTLVRINRNLLLYNYIGKDPAMMRTSIN